MTRIDAHQHFWRLARADYGWLTPRLAPIYRDFGIDDLRPHLAAAGIAATVLVQAAPTEAETEFLLTLAEESGGLVQGVVGWVDFEATDAPQRLERLARNPLLRGIRPMMQDISDTDWMLNSKLEPVFRALIDIDLGFDALVQPRHLPNVRKLLERHPALRLVIDHGAKPGIAVGEREPWATEMRRIAQETDAWCKLSGLVTEARPTWRVSDLRPFVDLLLESFGPERLIWGSDWPVVELAGGYERWWTATSELLRPLDPESRERVLGGNAVRFYGIAGIS